MKQKPKLLRLVALLLPIIFLSFVAKLNSQVPTPVTSVSSTPFQPFCVVTGYILTPSGSTGAISYDWYWSYTQNSGMSGNYYGTSYTSVHTWIWYQGDSSCDPIYITVFAHNNDGYSSGYEFSSDNCTPYDNCRPLKFYKLIKQKSFLAK